jgi:hypothetical protein
MAVLSEPAGKTRKTGQLYVALCAGGSKIDRKVAAALAEADLGVDVREVAGPGELADAEIDSNAIVVLGCDPDLPDQLAALRRARR